MQLCSREVDQFYTNQQCIRIEELFKGTVVKEQTMFPQEGTDFSPYDKVLIVMRIKLCHECWKKRCEVLHEPKMKMIVLKIKNQAQK